MRVIQGDCREVLAQMDECSVDSVVTDPPYGLTSARPGGRSEATEGRVLRGFMGMEWDSGVPGIDYWSQVRRVLKPGGHVLAFGGARTYHRLVCAVEDAGFEIRDTVMWLFGSGFPKSRNLDGEWSGWGTALKPAHEPIVLARRPLELPNLASNVDEYRTGALNIDGCRIAAEGGSPAALRRKGATNHLSDRPAREAEADGKMESRQSIESYQRDREGERIGRWPANVIHDGSDEVITAFPDAKGQQGALTGNEPSGKMGSANCYGRMDRRHESTPRIDRTTSAARFFYCAKAGREDRNDGCEGMDERSLNWSSGDKNPGSFQAEGTKKAAKNNHPTVKPTELMRYLCRLVTPRGGLVLDPFAGSGSTGRGAVIEGFDFIGIEQDESYVRIAEARIKAAAAQPDLFAGDVS